MSHYLTKAISQYGTNVYLFYDQYSYPIEMFLYFNCNLMEQFDRINYCFIRVRMIYCILLYSWQPLRHGSAGFVYFWVSNRNGVVRGSVVQLASQIIDQEKWYVYLTYLRTISDGADEYFHVFRTADILVSLFQQ